MLIGRANEIEEIVDAISQRKNLFLFGQESVGKTSIIKHVLDKTGVNGVLYSDNCSTIKTSLAGFLKGDYDSTFLSCQNVLSLRKLFYKKIYKGKPYLVFDHIGRVGPKFFSYLENLLDEHPALFIARSPDPGEIGDLSLLLFSFDKLEIHNLNRKYAYELITHFIESFGLVIDKVDHFRKEVFRLSSGNPAAIREICHYAGKEEYKVGKEIKFRLLNLDRKIDALKL
ncbi:MAG: ATP-binding protein [Candidatus Scalindua sp.]|nr:ATP-binding protein [Candidatus Scalindua sp.]MCR4343812.1 ATP-binding protein [Candidatus Scalindua sp.]